MTRSSTKGSRIGGLVLAGVVAAVGAPDRAHADDETIAPSAAPVAPPPPKSEKPDPKAKKDASTDSSVEAPHRYPPTAVRWGLIGGGALITLGAYGASLGISFGWPDVPGTDKLKIPFAGPWIAMAQVGCSPGNPNCGALKYVDAVLEAFDGVVQIAGLPLIGEGIFMTTEAAPAQKSAFAPTISVLPIVTPTTKGIGIFGRF